MCVELYYGGETRTEVMDAPQSFTCPLCAQIGFSEAELREHVSKKHAESAVLQEVICPVCAAYPNGDPNHLTDDLATHLTVEHRALEISSDMLGQWGSAEVINNTSKLSGLVNCVDNAQTNS